MSLFFSPSTASFFDEAIHGAVEIEKPQTKREIKAGKRPAMVPNPACRIPDDAIPITAERHAELMAEVAKGRLIIANPNTGKPIAVDHLCTTDEQVEARRRKRDRLLAESDWTQLADTLADDPSLKARWTDYRQQLRDLDMAGTDWPVAPDNDLGGAI
ncbi:phage tail assembly chaperone [Blastomonas sp.]|uniref:phage tail assembly chaperone n=1 Tax=Blastomonas sp. TaxID=1909299 RepID=UPI00406AA126